MIRPNFIEEKKLVKNRFLVFGIDEVGRGALAGPVAAGAVVFDPFSRKNFERFLQKKGVNDSKKLSPQKREELSVLIKEVSLCWGVGLSTPKEVDKKGIVWATEKAMWLAISSARKKLSTVSSPFLLVDGFKIKSVPDVDFLKQKAIVRGDQSSLSIAAASIIAKVYRDDLMTVLSRKFPAYGKFFWQDNKGYGTRVHREAIIQFGKTRHHRESFIHSIKL